MQQVALTDTTVELSVNSFEKAKDFYKRLGFDVVWEEPPKDQNGYLVMKLNQSILCFFCGNEKVSETDIVDLQLQEDQLENNSTENLASKMSLPFFYFHELLESKKSNVTIHLSLDKPEKNQSLLETLEIKKRLGLETVISELSQTSTVEIVKAMQIVSSINGELVLTFGSDNSGTLHRTLSFTNNPEYKDPHDYEHSLGVKKRKMQIHTHPKFINGRTIRTAFLPSPADLQMIQDDEGPYHIANGNGITIQIGKTTREKNTNFQEDRKLFSHFYRYGYGLKKTKTHYTDPMLSVEVEDILDTELSKLREDERIKKSEVGGSPFIIEVEKTYQAEEKDYITNRSFLCLPTKDFEKMPPEVAERLLMGEANPEEIKEILNRYGLEAMSVGR